MNDKKKIIIVGGGISGLTAGIYGLKSGYDVSIYEKNNIVGGECTGWDRRGYHIDNCIHWMMGTRKGTDLYEIWKTVGAIGDDIEIMTNDKMYTSCLNNQSITLWKDIDKTEEELLRLSPEDAEEIKKLMDNCRLASKVEIPADKPTDLKGPIELFKMGRKFKDVFKIFKEYEGQDTQDLMNKFNHPLIRCMISDFCTKESLASSFPMAYGNFISGDGGIPRGSSRAMAIRMGKKFEDMGGKIYTNSYVKKMEIEGTIGKYIVLENGEKIEGDYIILSCDTDYTFNHLLDKSYMDPILKKMYENRKDYPVYGMFQVAYAVDSSEDLLKGDMIFDCSDIKVNPWMGSRMTIKTYAYEPGFAPEGKQILQVLLGLDEEAYDYWIDLYKDKEAYKNKKEEIAKSLQRKIEEYIKGYKGKLDILDIWTPATYKRYCNAYKGYNQSFMITKNSDKNSYPSQYIKNLDNVLLSGQWINPPGGLPGAAITGKFAIQRILKKENKDINI